jgi:ankyrin repeat protein
MFAKSLSPSIHETILKFAIEKKLNEAENYLDEHLNEIDNLNKEGETPLHYLLKRYYQSLRSIANPEIVKKIVRLLIEKGAKEQLFYALKFGAACGDTEFIEIVLNRVSNLADLDPEGIGLYEAVTNDNVKIARMLLTAHASKEFIDLSGLSLLHLVKSADMVKVLVEFKFDVNQRQRGYNKDTPLHTAIRNSRKDVIVELLNCNADVALRTINNDTVLHLAAFQLDLLQLLYQKYTYLDAINLNYLTPLHYLLEKALLLKSAKDEEIKFFLTQGADCAMTNSHGMTILHATMKLRNLAGETYEFVLDKCKHIINIQDNEGRTALFYAVNSYQPYYLIKRLLQMNANPNIADNDGNIVLHEKLSEKVRFNDATKDEMKIINRLIKYMGDLDYHNKKNVSILHLLCGAGYLDQVKFLYERNNGIYEDLPPLEDDVLDSKNQQEQPPLFFALAECRIDVINYLLTKNCGLESIAPYRLLNPGDPIYTQQAAEQANMLFPISDQHKQRAIWLAISAIQFTRWSLSIEERKNHYEAYKNTLGILIRKFGAENFLDSSMNLFSEHLHSLDIINVKDHGTHTDIGAFPAAYMRSAQHIIENQYPLHGNMRDYGVLVNVKTLFGDKDFWQILHDDYWVIYQALLSHLKTWPENFTSHAAYCTGEFKTFEFFEKHFPEAFNYINANSPGVLLNEDRNLPWRVRY